MTYSSAFAALADPTRRAVFEGLRDSPRSVRQLADSLPVSRPAVSQHLRVLKEAGLVTAAREGNRSLYRIDARGLEELRVDVDRFWTDVLDGYEKAARQKGEKEK